VATAASARAFSKAFWKRRERVEYDLVYSDADADLESIQAAVTDTERVAFILTLARRRFRAATRVPSSLRVAVGPVTRHYPMRSAVYR
jgi:hypothetical protein